MRLRDHLQARQGRRRPPRRLGQELGQRARAGGDALGVGRQVLEAGRARRVRALVERLRRIGESEQRALARGVEILERAIR